MSLLVIWQYMDRSIYCHMTLSAMNYLLYKSTSLLTIWLIIYFTKKNMWLIIYCTQKKHVVDYLLHSKQTCGWLSTALKTIWLINTKCDLRDPSVVPFQTCIRCFTPFSQLFFFKFTMYTNILFVSS